MNLNIMVMGQPYRIILFFAFLFIFQIKNSYGQCVNPALYDIGLTSVSSNPVWVNCIDNPSTPNSFTLNLVSNHNINSFSVAWGDGNTSSGGAITAGNIIATHTYTTLDSFKVSYTETIAGCAAKTIIGKVINDRKTGASALPPTLGSSGCVPHALTFINQSNNPSQHTKFIWDWADGTMDATKGIAAASSPISHTFTKGKAGCNMTIKLNAQSLCATTFSSYGPFDFWDIDTALVRASATVLCNSDNVTFTDISRYNCNISYPRRVRWSWIKPDGSFEYILGAASGQYWVPATPANRTFTKYLTGTPGQKYHVILEDSNFCGVATDAIDVTFVNPPKALFTNNTPGICAGDTARLTNNSTGNPDMIYINWGDNVAWDSYVGTTKTFKHSYSTPNTYTIKFVASRNSSQTCADTTQQTIQVIPASISQFNLDKSEGCGSVTVNITDASTNNPVSWSWDFGDGTTYVGQNPPAHSYGVPGGYVVTLATKNNLSCGIPKSKVITVYPSIDANFAASSVCFGDTVRFFDASTIIGVPCNVGNIKVERFENVNGTYVIDLTNSPNFPANPTTVYDLQGTTLSIPPTSPNIDNFGARVRGFVCPPVTGDYTFYISSDDNSELYISPSGDPAAKTKIAYVIGYTAVNQWNKFTSQMSAPIKLNAGQSYYIEMLMKDGGGLDHMEVAWEVPGVITRTLIPKSRLSPYVEGNAITTWKWNFGDGTNSTKVSPTHFYTAAGTYNVQLQVSTGKCSTTVTKPVNVNPSPVINFSLPAYQSCTPFVTNFSNTTTGATTYEWAFGDGSALSNAKNPAHTFYNYTNSTVSYLVSLTASNASGCKASKDKTITVYPGPVAGFQYTPSLPQCSPSKITFEEKAIVQHPATFQWTMGDGTTYNFDSSDPLYTGTFDHVFTNKTGAIIYDTVRLKVTSSAGGCIGETYKLVIVYPEPEFKIVAVPSEGCHPLKVNFFGNGINSGYTWSFGDGTPNSSSSNPLHTFNNTSSADKVYKVVLTGRSIFGCAGKDSTTITVHPKPTAAFNLSYSNQCSPVDALFTNNSSTDANQFSWNYGDGTVNNSNTKSNVNYQYNNTASSNQTYIASLIATNTYGCSDTTTNSITVYPKVTADFTPSPSAGCSPLTVDFFNASTPLNVPGFTYSWDFGDGGSTSNGKDEKRVFYNNNTGSDKTFNVKLVATAPASLGSCSSTAIKNIIVHSKPTVTLTVPPSDTVGCSPHDVTFNSVAATDVVNKYWNFADANSSTSTMNSLTHTYKNTGNFSNLLTPSIIVETAFGCKDTAAVQVRVHPEVHAQFNPSSLQGCSPLLINFINTSSPQITIGQNSWNFGDNSYSAFQDVQHTFINESGSNSTNTVTLKVTSIYGCQDQTSKTVTVFSKPKANYDLLSNPFGCNPYPVNFKNTSTGGSKITWNFGDGTTSNSNLSNVSHTYSNSGNSTKQYTFNLTVESGNGCKDDTSGLVNVYPFLKADFNPTASLGCSPLAVGFQNISIGASTYLWDFGDGTSSTDTIPSKVFSNNDPANTNASQNFTVKLVAQSVFGCKDTTTRNLVVNPKPKVSLISDKSEGCTPLLINYQNTSQPKNFIISNKWKWGDGTEESNNNSNVKHTFTNTSTSIDKNYVVKLVVTNTYQCKDSIEQAVKVFPKIVAAFVSTDTIGCSPHKISFTNNSQGATSYQWSFGANGTSSDNNPVFTFVNDAPSVTKRIDNIQLISISANGCKDTATKHAVIYPKPDAKFSVSNSPGCSPLAASMTNLSVGATTYVWAYGDNDSSKVANPSPHTFINATNNEVNYNPTLFVANSFGCKDTTQQLVTVWPGAHAIFVPSVIAGCTPLQVNFTNLSTNNSFNEWNFGDNSFVDPRLNPDHIFYNTGLSDSIYKVKLKVSTNRGCIDTTAVNITVYPRPVPSFVSVPTQITPQDSILFTNTTPGSWATYNWDFNDGSISAQKDPGYHPYLVTGIYNVKLTVTSDHGCAGSFTDNVRVIEAPPDANFYGSGKGCQTVTVTFYNQSFNSKDFTWDFGDGSPPIKTDNLAPIQHTFVNNSYITKSFNITLKAQSPGGQVDYLTVMDSVIVYPMPSIYFEARPDTVYMPNAEVLFVNDTKPYAGTHFLWTFGDGDTATVASPTHKYVKSGVFDVTLKATTAEGCVEIQTMHAVVTVKDGGIIKMPNAFTPVMDGSKGSKAGSGINDVFAPGYHAGLVKYKLYIFNKWGELLFESNDVETGWDGYFKGKLCQEDVYVYKVFAQGADGNTQELVGDVTLLHK